MAYRARLLKVVLVGDSNVGKSSLMHRFISNSCASGSIATIGVDFLNKDVIVDGELYTLQIWDTAGEERFKSMRTPFYRGADCCVLTFALDDVQSFRNLPMWCNEFFYYADIQLGTVFPFVVIGNKLDLSKREVTAEEANAWCMANGNLPYFETSVESAYAANVKRAFVSVVRNFLQLEKVMGPKPARGYGLRLNREGTRASRCC